MGILDDNNFLAGSFNKETAKRSPDERDRSSRRVAIAGIVLSVIWLFGFGSLLGIICGLVAIGDAETPTSRRLSIAAIVLGVIGLAVGVIPFFTN